MKNYSIAFVGKAVPHKTFKRKLTAKIYKWFRSTKNKPLKTMELIEGFWCNI